MNEAEQIEEPTEQQDNQFEPMTNDQLASVCLEEIARGIGGNVSSDSNAEISTALDYYFGRQPGLSKVKAKDKNASRYVSQDVMDAVESTVAELMPSFVTDQIGVYEPEDERDEDMARQETDIVNYLLMEEYDGYTLIQTALKDALLHRNCTVKAYWDERVEVEYEEFEDVPELALVDILTPEDENQPIEVVEQYVSEEADLQAEAYINSQKHQLDMQNIQMAAQDPNTQQNPEIQQSMQQMQEVMDAAQDKYSIKIKRMTKTGRPVLDALPPENVIVAGEHDSPMLNNVRFCAHEMVVTKSDLIEQGFDPIIVNRLPEYNSSIENISRGRESEEYDYTSAHESTRLVRVFDVYINVDFDGDGIAERRRVILGNNTVMDNDEISEVAMIGGCTTIMPHKYKGISMFDRMRTIQDAKTPVMRSIIDGTQLSSNPRIGVVTGEGTNIDDILSSRTGGVVRTGSANGIFEIPNPQVPQSSYTFLEHMDSIRRYRGGGAVDTAQQAQSVSGDTAHGIERVMSAMELGSAMYARTFGETLLRGIFIELHNILRKNHPGFIQAKVGGRWVQSMPNEWKKRTNVTIHVGSSFSERARQANVMNNIIMTQVGLAETGNVMYSLDKHYRALVDMVRLSGIKNPETYYLDPTSEEGQQAQEVQSQQQLQAKQQQDEMQAKIAEAQQKLAEAEQIKGVAQLKSAEDRAANEGLKNQITALKDQLNSAAKSEELQLKKDTQADAVALKLTELELNAGRDLNEQVDDNQDVSEVEEDETDES